MTEKHQFNFSVPSLLLLNVLVTCFLDAIRYLLKYFGLLPLVLVWMGSKFNYQSTPSSGMLPVSHTFLEVVLGLES